MTPLGALRVVLLVGFRLVSVDTSPENSAGSVSSSRLLQQSLRRDSQQPQHVIRWDRYVVQDWGASSGRCKEGARIDDYQLCQRAFSIYKSWCGTEDEGMEQETRDGQPGCQMQEAGFAEFHYNANLVGTGSPGYSPVCELDKVQSTVQCYDEAKVPQDPATTPAPWLEIRKPSRQVIRWDRYVIQDWGAGICREGKRIDNYELCKHVFSTYKARCDTADDGPQYETWRGQPGCHLQNADFAEFQFNADMHGLGREGHAPVCELEEDQDFVQCYDESASHASGVRAKLNAIISLLLVLVCIVACTGTCSFFMCYYFKWFCFKSEAPPPMLAVPASLLDPNSTVVVGRPIQPGEQSSFGASSYDASAKE
eukprot:TRINITY_DN35561_c0_g1_i1.p1 TRINITY_DN35561_c0_g1~~TRINITY_DN35561_c0_g1_i1.p1  ORF type:complete len:368 (+),score=26.27 TRINITY_DN35561_c0_g1_i1:85-1188(+)